jgi:hypothetical protein
MVDFRSSSSMIINIKYSHLEEKNKRKATAMSLVGKFVFISNGQYYKFGQVLEATDEHNEFFLVKIFSPGHKSDTQSLYNINQMLQVDDKSPEEEDERVIWIFFNTEDELTKYVKKVETPPKKKSVKGDGKVIQFVRGTNERT